MRFVVTGGAGFIGSHLVEHLIAEGHDVVVLDNLSTGKLANIAPWMDRVEFVEGSITNPRTCAQALKGADFVLHQAALPSVPRSVHDPVATHETCLTGTLNVLTAALDAGVRRVVYAASSSAYGNTEELPKHEGMSPRPMSPYAAAKLGGENYLRAFHTSYGLETVALRYFNIFGPRQDPTSQYSAVIPRFISQAVRGEGPVIFGDGEQTRDFTFVANVVRANMLACLAPASACGQVYNVGCGDRITVNMLWQKIRGMVGTSAEPRYEPARTGDVRDSLASLDRIRQNLGYEPLIPLEEGLSRTVEFCLPRRTPRSIAALDPRERMRTPVRSDWRPRKPVA
jgi:nucleoside-diphosphate-sugar epimerase